MAAADPGLLTNDARRAAAQGDLKGVAAGGEEALLDIVMATHSGISVEDFQASVGDWLATAKNPATGMGYDEMTYQPMVELLGYLRDNGFETYIVSGGGVHFMRAFAERAYGIPPQNVIGSQSESELAMVDGVPTVVKTAGIAFIDDKEGKPQYRQTADLCGGKFRWRLCHAAIDHRRKRATLCHDRAPYRCRP
jgi:hypothetical protein